MEATSRHAALADQEIEVTIRARAFLPPANLVCPDRAAVVVA